MVRLTKATTIAQVSAQKNGREPGAQRVTRSQDNEGREIGKRTGSNNSIEEKT